MGKISLSDKCSENKKGGWTILDLGKGSFSSGCRTVSAEGIVSELDLVMHACGVHIM